MSRRPSAFQPSSMQRNARKAESMLKLLANARRLMILCYLVKGEKTVSELIALVNLSQSALSQHLARLRAHKIVRTEKRGREVFYGLATPEVKSILATLYRTYCKN